MSYNYSHHKTIQYNKPHRYKIYSKTFNKQNINKLKNHVIEKIKIIQHVNKYDNLNYGWNIIKMPNNYNIIIKTYDKYSFDSYKIKTIIINNILITYYINVIQKYNNNNEINFNIGLILAYITLTIEEGQIFCSKLKKNKNIKYFDNIANEIILNFVDISKELFGSKEKENDNKFNDITNKNLVIVAKVLNELNYNILLNYKILYNAIKYNNYLLVKYILEIIKLHNVDINKIYFDNYYTIKINLVDYLINETIYKFKINNINTTSKIYELLLKYGAIPANCNNSQYKLCIFYERGYKLIQIIKSVQKCFENVYLQCIYNIINKINLIYYPKVIINIIITYLQETI
jgi:hypothetical protein